MEIFDVVNENGEPTGQTVERAYAHAHAVPHRTSHVWIFSKENGKTQLLLQKRCMEKDSYPGCYDISSAGHIPAGVDYVSSALRELSEELGITAQPTELICCGLRHIVADDIFRGVPYHDRQISKVFLLERALSTAFTVQKEEIESVRWMELDEIYAAVKNNTFPNCIALVELDMLKRAL